MGPRSIEPATPRDIVCRIHHYSLKDLLSQRAWKHGPYDHMGCSTAMLPDLSRSTLQHLALLRPLLDKLKNAGVAYRWGFPFHLIVRRGEGSFFLRHPMDLLDLFAFVEFQSIDWCCSLLSLSAPDKAVGEDVERFHRSREVILHH